MRKKIEKNFWDMEIIGNRRKMTFFRNKKNMTNILLNLYFGQSGSKVRNQETSETSKSVSIGLRIDTFQYFHHVL